MGETAGMVGLGCLTCAAPMVLLNALREIVAAAVVVGGVAGAPTWTRTAVRSCMYLAQEK